MNGMPVSRRLVAIHTKIAIRPRSWSNWETAPFFSNGANISYHNPICPKWDRKGCFLRY